MVDIGEPYDLQESTYITGICDKQTKLCACNPSTGYGCNIKNGEQHVIDKSSMYMCTAVGSSIGVAE